MQDNGILQESAPAGSYNDVVDVPEEPFGIPVSYWKGGIILFSCILMAATLLLLLRGNTPHVLGALYVIPAILFAYFYRRRGVLIVYLLSMFFFTMVVIFRYPSADDLITAALLIALLIAIALTVSYLTHYLLLEKRKYHAIFDNTENGVALINIHSFAILEMNARFAEALGLTGPETMNRSLDAFLVDTAPLQNIAAVLDSRCSTPALEFTMRRTDGSVWASVIAARKISADHVVLTFIDITERRKIEKELRQSHAESNLYLDILTHDINNMNAAGLTYSRMLADPTKGAREETGLKILRPLEKIEEIIRNISVLRKLRAEPVTLSRVRLAPILQREIALFPSVTIDYDGSDAAVLADDMLASVFTNLIGNAAKFGGSGSRVIIRVEDRGTEAGVTVADTGKGIPDTLKPVVFERFQRGDTTVSGKGLGLFICKSLIERYGGTIRVGDRVPGDPSQGAAFQITLKKG